MVEDISKALGLYEKGDYDGSWAFLRGRAYAQLGQYQEAVRDFEAAIERGNQYLRSYALNSNPKFDAKRKFQQQLRGYHEEKNRVLQLMK